MLLPYFSLISFQESGVLGTDSPRALLNAVFFYNGRKFFLRGGEEHRFLRLSQFQRYSNPDRYEYTESGSKKNSGGLEDIQAQRRNKIVPIYKILRQETGAMSPFWTFTSQKYLLNQCSTIYIVFISTSGM